MPLVPSLLALMLTGGVVAILTLFQKVMGAE
jgi:hypothetical protein